MPSFSTLARWEPYAPPIDNNRQLEKPFVLRVRSGLTRPEYDALREREQAFWKRLAEEEGGTAVAGESGCALDLFEKTLAGVVELGAEPLSLNGTPITEMRQLLEALLQEQGYGLTFDLFGAVHWHNQVSGAKELFSARLSGGKAFTPTAAPKTAAP